MRIISIRYANEIEYFATFPYDTDNWNIDCQRICRNC